MGPVQVTALIAAGIAKYLTEALISVGRKYSSLNFVQNDFSWWGLSYK